MSSRLIVLTLTLLLGLQPMTTDLYLPALPGLVQDLGASMAQAQLTLTALLLAFGLSQLVWGPLSDRFGRRPILLIGLLAYALAAVGSALSQTMDQLILWRTVQGAAMGAGVMCARAIVRDLYAPARGANVMSQGLSGLGLIACVAAPLGGLVTAWFNWHAALLVLAVFGTLTLALLSWSFQESIPHHNPHALQPARLLANWWMILRNPTFLAYSALSTASYGGLFTFLASSSFVFIQLLGYSTTQYGLFMFTNSLIYLIGTFLCRRMIKRWGVPRSVMLAALLSLGGGCGMALLALSNWHSGWAVMLPMGAFILGHGIHQPCGQSGAVGPFPQVAGTASALNGFMMMLAAFAMGQWLGRHMDGTVFPLAYGLCFWGTLVALSAWTLVRRYGHG